MRCPHSSLALYRSLPSLQPPSLPDFNAQQARRYDRQSNRCFQGSCLDLQNRLVERDRFQLLIHERVNNVNATLFRLSDMGLKLFRVRWVLVRLWPKDHDIQHETSGRGEDRRPHETLGLTLGKTRRGDDHRTAVSEQDSTLGVQRICELKLTLNPRLCNLLDPLQSAQDALAILRRALRTAAVFAVES